WVVFFFSSRRRHTISYGDWSSDVCSSDLAPPDAEPEPESAASSKSILVVDDEPEIAALLAEMLTNDGHRVEAVEDGLMALARLEIGRASCRERVEGAGGGAGGKERQGDDR